MHPPRSTFLILVASSLAGAWQIPFFNTQAPVAAPAVTEEAVIETTDPTTRVAIIGAGAGGSSAAFWIGLAKERLGVDVHVDVYEKADYIGGRSTIVYPYDDPSVGPQELGGSIFVAANKNLMRAGKEFNLTLIPLSDDDTDMGIWNGKEFVMTTRGSWWDNAKIVWRYGYFGPKKVFESVSEFLSLFVKIYTPEYQNWADIPALTKAFNFTSLLTQTTASYFESKGVYPLFVREVVEAATRVNYAQDVTALHALEGSVSMSTDNAYQVKGGNYQIFEQFLKRSNANIHMKTTVTGLTKKEVAGQTRWVVSTTSSPTPPPSYNQVILAAPQHLSGITLVGSSAVFPPVEYVRLHVTLVSTTSKHVNPAYFGVSWSPESMPSMILTTAEGVRNGGPPPEFNSVSHHRTIVKDGREEHIFKIFSYERKEDEWLETVFGKGTVGWVFRKEWDSYPKLPPTETFPPVKADEGLWYVNSFEPWISTMETETVSSRNIVDLMLQEAFGQGICPTKTEQQTEDNSEEDKLVGWDC